MANGGNPNDNTKCGSQISIYHPASGQTVQATVVDTCTGCAMHDIDVSVSLFTTLAGGLSAGRVAVDWGGHTLLWLEILCRELTSEQNCKGKRPSSKSDALCAGAAGSVRSQAVFGMAGIVWNSVIEN